MSFDKISLTGLVFYGYHGVLPAERQIGQRFVVDLDLTLDLRPAGASDDLRQTVDYGQVYRAVKQIVEGPPGNLIEAVAERIAAAVLADWPVEAVRVRVAKPQAPLPGCFAEAAVEITRRRPGY